MSDKGVCRTALAEPGLLKSQHNSHLFRRESISTLPWGVPSLAVFKGSLKQIKTDLIQEIQLLKMGIKVNEL